MNRTKLTHLRKAAMIWQAAAGARSTFDPSRQPHLTITPDAEVTQIQAGVSPDCTYRLVKAAIEAAQREICLYIYNASADHLLDLLRAAKIRGVRIRLMYDVSDTRGDEAQKLAALGVELQVAPSSGGRRVFTVCHQKFAVIDEAILLLGSANWAGTSIPLVTTPGLFKKGNREWVVRIDHAPVAQWFKALFVADWEIPALPISAAMVSPVEALPVELFLPRLPGRVPDQIFDIKQVQLAQPARVTPIISPNNYFDLARQLIISAQQSIDIEQQYILAARGRSKIEGLLKALAQRKSEVTIRIIVSPAYRKVGAMDNWELSQATLAAYNLQDCLRAMNLTYYTHLHNKGLIVDRQKVVVSSTNWSENSITRAREAGVLIEAPEVAGYFAEVFDFDWRVATDPTLLPANAPLILADAAQEDATAGLGEEVHPADLI